MRTSLSKVSAAVLVVILATGALAVPASAMTRDGGVDGPIVRVIKQLLHKLHLIAPQGDEQPAVPHP
jgi:hypothetical protein